jgi:K+-transporting ATPase ATPase A chain
VTTVGWLQIVLFAVVLTASVPLVGGYMARVFSGEAIVLDRVFGPIERGLYRLLGVRPEQQCDWRGYARAILTFNVIGFVVLYAILRTQGIHPWNPAGLTAPPWDLSFNTAASFVTNTDWQFYGGETTLSNFSQMTGLAVQNFLSAAVGIAVCVAVIRGFSRRSTGELGNPWVDLTRSLLYVLVPLSFVLALLLVTQGAVQTLSGSTTVHTLTGAAQTLVTGPVASQEAIKQLGTNGGGFYNVNAAMPFENPTGLSNFVLMVSILLIPAGLTATFGRMVGNRRQGWAIYAAMLVVFLAGVVVVALSEDVRTAAMHAAGVHGPNMEGKETRFGIGSSALFAVVTTVASCGAVNAAMESLTGLGAAIPLANMSTGEVIFGGVGSGLYGMLLFVLLAVFLAGLMVGRTPEYLGKKIGAREIKLVAIGTLAVPLVVLILTAIAIATHDGRASIFAAGPQGFSETLYAYTSQANNNGSAFAGYTGFLQPNGTNIGAATVTFSNIVGGLAMLAGRFLPMLASLAVAGALAGRRTALPGPGTMRTDTPTFVVLLIASILLVALLTFVPALLLGPVAQALTDRLF